MRETGYGSDEFLRACRLAAACRAIEGVGPRAAWRRRRAGSANLARYQRRLPLTELRLTDSPPGRMIAEHFAIRDADGFRYRTAQGVLDLPADFGDYLRGRRRQALRTNIGHARRQGYTARAYAVDNWHPGADDTRRAAISPGPIERWLLTGPDGVVADSILTVDRDVALLHGLVSFGPYARWLLHAAIIERLCGECTVLVTNSDDAYFLAPGNQHFQRLLGFQIRRLEVDRAHDLAPLRSLHPAGLRWPPEEPFTCGIPRQGEDLTVVEAPPPPTELPAAVLAPA
jgi:hypothetical protein